MSTATTITTANTTNITGKKKWLEEAIKNEHIIYYEYKNFVDLKLIGRGAFGEVFRAKSLKYRKTMALKSIRLDSDAAFENFVNELKQHRKVESHDNILRFHGITKKDEKSEIDYMLVIEYADGGTLRNYLKNNKLTWDTKLDLGKEIASAVTCLHDNNIVHRDLHSENILILNGVAKLSDFGISKRVVDSTNAVNRAMGSVKYSDPRYLKNHNYSRDKKSDTYSVGVLLWEISSGRVPFEGSPVDFGLMSLIVEGKREKVIKGTPKKYVEIYKDCWQDDPEKRPLLGKVLEELETVDINVLTDIDDDYDSSEAVPDPTMPVYDYLKTAASKDLGLLLPNDFNDESQNVKNGHLKDDQQQPLTPPTSDPSPPSTTSLHIEDSENETTGNKSQVIINEIIEKNFNHLRITEFDRVKKDIKDLIKQQNASESEILKELIDTKEGPPTYLTLIGFFYYAGIGTPINHVESAKYFAESANRKEAAGQAWLGYCLENGKGIERDTKKAFELYFDSARQNNTFGQYFAGCCYSTGRGVSRNTCEATKLLKAAHENGETRAKIQLEKLENEKKKAQKDKS